MFGIKRKSDSSSIYAILYNKASNSFERPKKWCAGFLHARINNLSPVGRKTLFAAGMFLFVLMYCMILFGTISFSTGLTKVIIEKPRVNIQQKFPSPVDAHISAVDTLSILQIRNTIDSLSRSEEGRLTIDSFINKNPDFMSRLQEAEKTIK